ncbi:arsenate reductase family protein [Sulfurovum sp. zt1-1]|uniref:Arsenate reductase family protein n=1 Tax=Sulfurovum zhangzhouensis TaxID=3019067 RepID=A0ABT7QVJ1_9BACT|nr:ArsC/Spx/MgsR family protein [Sulfurovum zhangzhouensis]MDM5270808.1 arsenate reductase family protein [Sulfurovum zhangzhouensis]
MKLIIFYEKPGCITNNKQKSSLRNAGCMVIGRSLLDHQMSHEELYTYLEKRPVKEWFNPNAPAVKNGEIDPNSYTEEEALDLLFHHPILIRRPLISVDGRRMCGFDKSVIEGILELSLEINRVEECTSDTACPPPVSSASSK